MLENYFDSKKALDTIRLLCKGVSEPLIGLCNEFSEETDDFKKMDFYSGLLKKTIGPIVKTDEDKEVKSLFKSGGTTALTNKIKGFEDFNLISFIIIK